MQNSPSFDIVLKPDMIKRMDYVIRYSSIPVVHQETVSQHSYWVAFYSLLIHKTIGGREHLTGKLLTAALIHDAAESLSGDIVRTFKYSSSSLKTEIDKAEELIIKSMPETIQNLFKEIDDIVIDYDKAYVKAVVKAADFVSLYRYMYREAALHNMEVIPFYKRMIDDLIKQSKSSMECLRPLYFDMMCYARNTALKCFGDQWDESCWDHEI